MLTLSFICDSRVLIEAHTTKCGSQLFLSGLLLVTHRTKQNQKLVQTSRSLVRPIGQSTFPCSKFMSLEPRWSQLSLWLPSWASSSCVTSTELNKTLVKEHNDTQNTKIVPWFLSELVSASVRKVFQVLVSQLSRLTWFFWECSVSSMAQTVSQTIKFLRRCIIKFKSKWKHIIWYNICDPLWYQKEKKIW